MRSIPAIFFGCVLLYACANPDSGTAQKEFARGCADDDLNSNAVLYFGPSNQIGPGSVWSRLGQTGGYQPQWRVQDLGVEQRVIAQGVKFQCDLSRSSKLEASAGLAVVSAVANASADAKADFSRAKVMKVTSTGAAWDTVVAGPYTVALKTLPSGAMRSDVFGPNRLILRRALRLDGYRVLLDFDTSVKPQVKAKYTGKLLGRETLGDVGAQFSANWTSDDKLELTAGDSIYVAGEFAELVNGDFVGSRGEASISDLGDKFMRPTPTRP